MTGTILSANGTRLAELGGDHAWLQRVKGDICVSYQWLDLGQRDPVPCMVLFPTSLRFEAGAYVIPQGNAYFYVDNRGRPTQDLMNAGVGAAEQLGFFPDKSTVYRLIDAIIEGIPDLIKMPSEQPTDLDTGRQIVGIEARAKINGQTIHEEVL